tara:strand:- start:315 stop:1007 length:693 start_codon:yes stop_codon:yes gene_type:complete
VRLIEPDWGISRNIKAFVTCRGHGFSKAPYNSLNLSNQVGDVGKSVEKNRGLLDLPGEPRYLTQVHGNECVPACRASRGVKADASFTAKRNEVLTVLVADCVPVLFANKNGTRVGAAHAGWRGLANGVLRRTVEAIGLSSLCAWIGPCIGPCHYSVKRDVFDRFPTDLGFKEISMNRWEMDLAGIAEAQLIGLGVQVYGGGFCTFCDEENFFSYRRDGKTGRMGAFIWIQ